MTTVILVHGWGYDASLWDPVRARLDPALRVETLDFGFFGAEKKASAGGTATLAVGHSLGALWWLAQAEMPWRRLLCINGFPRFLAAPDFPFAIAPRVLARMRSQFARDPAGVLKDFHALCGASGTWAPAGTPDHERLAAGLGWLANWDGRATLAARAPDVFALAGCDDLIVPRSMSTPAFAGLPSGHLAFGEAPGHLLPVVEPDLCAQWIARLAA
ncbi:MAG: hypothetical protein AB1642_06000 [Pseudomonadota bacterium]